MSGEVEVILQENEEWIIEGNYSQTLPSRISQSTQVFFLDYPRCIYVFRVIKRIGKTYGKVRKDMASGCPERLDLSFLRYVWAFKKLRRTKLLNIVHSELPDGCELIIFNHPKECKNYLKTLN